MKVERGGGQSESVCTFCVTTATTSSWMSLLMTHTQRRSIHRNKTREKSWTFINRGLHLRAMWPHVFVRSCTAAAEKKKKNRLPPHQLKCDCTLPSSSNDQRDKDPVYRKLTETHSGPNVRQKTFDLHADCLTTNTKTRRENILCSADFGRGAITFHRPRFKRTLNIRLYTKKTHTQQSKQDCEDYFKE